MSVDDVASGVDEVAAVVYGTTLAVHPFTVLVEPDDYVACPVFIKVTHDVTEFVLLAFQVVEQGYVAIVLLQYLPVQLDPPAFVH